MAKTTNNQLQKLADAIFLEHSERIPTELLPIMVVFGLIAIFNGIARRIIKEKEHANPTK